MFSRVFPKSFFEIIYPKNSVTTEFFNNATSNQKENFLEATKTEVKNLNSMIDKYETYLSLPERTGSQINAKRPSDGEGDRNGGSKKAKDG